MSDLFKQLMIGAIDRPGGVPDASADGILDGVLNLVFIVITAISFIVIIIQGVKYSLSSGEPEKTTQARNGIIYALVGLVIAISAWSIVNFAISRVIRDDSTEAETSTLINLLGDIGALIAFIAGIISVIMIIIGGLRMITGSNAESVKKARDTIIYALVGLAVTIIAGPIIHFVLERVSQS